jgi:glutathione S-transferase
MILIGQYDSPYVRRVGIALTLYGLPFEHRPWSVFGDGDSIRSLNPLMRVPTLVLEDGDVVVDSATIIDHLDSLVPDDRTMFPRGGAERRRALRIAALATGLGDKAVSLFYEHRMHKEVSKVWSDRCRSQIEATLSVLEDECATVTSAWWFGDRIGHADIAAACVLRFLSEVHPDSYATARYPALTGLCAQAELLDVFRVISQPFSPPT